MRLRKRVIEAEAIQLTAASEAECVAFAGEGSKMEQYNPLGARFLSVYVRPMFSDSAFYGDWLVRFADGELLVYSNRDCVDCGLIENDAERLFREWDVVE